MRTDTTRRVNRARWARASFVCAALAAWLMPAGPADAQLDFEVVSVPWVGTAPSVPHDGVAGEPHYLQAVARNCALGIEYRWDFDGNGIYDMDWAAAPNRWNLGTQFTYDGLEETRLFIARVEGRCGGAEGPTATADFPVRMHVDPTRGIRINRSISNGLWWGHISLARNEVTRTASFGNAGGNWADTALLAQAMMNRGHKHGVDPGTDPYIESALWMLHYVLQHYVTLAAPGLQAGEDPDVNGNGIVLEADEGGVHGGANYVGGGALEAIASWPNQDYMIPADIGAPVNVAGRRLGDVVQDAAEFYMYSQTDIAFEGGIAGGWDYDINSAGIDSSQVGWAAVGLFASRESAGADVPGWVTERLERGVRYMDYGLATGGAATGGYGYRTRGEAARQGNPARSGAMLNALGFATDGDRAHPSVVATVDFIARAFDNPPADGFGGEIFGNFYAMFQVSKGMRSFQPPYETIGEGVDWYARTADWLIENQNADGSWLTAVRWTNNRHITHSLGLLVLIPTLFEAPPTAVAQAAPTSVGPGDTVTFYHGGSYALDPAHPIQTYRWDFVRYPDGLDLNGDGDFDDEGEHAPEDLNGDGAVTGDEIVWEVETDDADLRPTWAFEAEIEFGDVLEFEVNLQVEDDIGRKDDDRESVVIEVSYVNHPPVALAHPGGNDRSYLGLVGNSVRLDGSASFDPDSDDEPAEGFPRDTLTFVGWDLDGDGTFETEGAVIDFPIPDNAIIDAAIVVQFRVCDDGTWLGVPDEECEGGDCSLCRTADARINVTAGPDIVLGDGQTEFTVAEGESLSIDASGSSHPRDVDFDLIWYCDDAPITAHVDALGATFDARDIDGKLAGPTVECSVTAIDIAGVSVMIPFTVTVENVAPEITVADVVGDPIEGGSVDIVVRADDVPGDAPFLLYSVDCDGDGTFEVRNTRNNVVACALDDGRYDPIVQVDDQDGGVDIAELEGFDVENIPPTFADIECPAVEEGELMVLQISVSDPADQVACRLGAPRPDQSQLAAGDCTLVWTPTYAQALAGRVEFSITADDGDGGVTALGLTCFPTIRDGDGDGLPDSWEERFGTDPTVEDCDVDYDADGMSNCEEFEGDTLPRVYEGPGLPSLIEPVGGVIVDTATPTLVSRNTVDDLGRDLDYVYWLFDSADGDPIHMSDPVAETPAQTGYPAPDGLLEENATYYWTVAATNGRVTGPSPQRARFVVDAVEEPAPAPRIIAPADGGMSPDAIPPIALTPVTDPDPGDELTYECEAATDADFEDVAGTADGDAVGGRVSVEFDGLAGDTTYWIRCRALDQDGNPGDWSDPIRYAINQAPVAAVDPPVLELPEGGDGVVQSASTDPDDGELTYEWRCPEALGVVADGPTLNVDAALDGPAGGRTFQCRLTVTDAHGARDSTDFVVRVHNVAPTAQVVCPAVEEGTPVQILVEGIDPGGDQIACSWAMPAPAASGLAGCTVEWTPTYAQAIAGEVHFAVRLTDDDGASTDVPFTCNPTFLDADGNGLPDTWQDDNDIDDPEGDDDGDGVSNGDEWADGTDPNHYDGPAPLSLVSPVGDEIVQSPTPVLVVNNGTDGLDRALQYRYAVFETADAEAPLFVSDLVDEGDETTAWQVAEALAENGRFWWTAQADNGVAPGPWADRESFRVDETAEAPDPPTILRPASGDAVDDTPVRVTLENSADPDPDPELTYDCQLAVDEAFEQQVGAGEAVEGPDGTTRVDIEALVGENQSYWIRCRATDETGLQSGWSEPVKVGIDRTNEPPTAPTVISPEPGALIEVGDISFTVGESTDPEDDALTYFIEVSADPDFLAVLVTASAEASGDNQATFGPETLTPGVWYVRTWAHDGLLAGAITVEQFEVFDPNAGEDTINGGGCACDVNDADADPVSPLAALLGLLILGLRRRQR